MNEKGTTHFEVHDEEREQSKIMQRLEVSLDEADDVDERVFRVHPSRRVLRSGKRGRRVRKEANEERCRTD